MEIERLNTTENIQPATLDQVSNQTSKPSPVLDLQDLYCILQIQPNDSFMALELGMRLNQLGRTDEALRIFKSVIKIDSRFETLSALGLLEYRMDLIDDAFHHLQQAILVSADGQPEELFEVFKTLGNIFVRRADFELAEDNYNKAHRIHSSSDVLAVNFGTLAIQKQSWEAALEHFRRAIELNKKNDKAWVGLAIGHRMKGDFELAWGNLETALTYNPLNEVALNLALEWGSQEGREFRVLEFLRTFLVEGGWDEKLSMAFAWLSHRRGESMVARFELERVLAVNPANTRAHALAAEIRTQV